jgi:methyl coenzyme M reductase gamma subunit
MLEALPKERHAESEPAVQRENGQPDLRIDAWKRHVGDRDQRASSVLDGEDRIAREIDRARVRGDARRAERGAEAQATILRRQGEEMRDDTQAVDVVQALHGGRFNALGAACSPSV